VSVNRDSTDTHNLGSSSGGAQKRVRRKEKKSAKKMHKKCAKKNPRILFVSRYPFTALQTPPCLGQVFIPAPRVRTPEPSSRPATQGPQVFMRKAILLYSWPIHPKWAYLILSARNLEEIRIKEIHENFRVDCNWDLISDS
jgi:hypothetical protein